MMNRALLSSSIWMNQSKATLALDVGERRIGVAVTDGIVRIARPLETIEVDGQELDQIIRFIDEEKITTIVVGYPRNQSGEATAQTAFVEAFKNRLSEVTDVPITFRDESLTSVLAEERLRSYGKPYAKGDI